MGLVVPKEALTFLNKLEKNNNRDWFNNNKTKFKAIQKEVKMFYNAIFERLNKHDDIEKLKM